MGMVDPAKRIACRMKGLSDERIVAGWFTLYSEDREKPPFADRALRPVGNATQARGRAAARRLPRRLAAPAIRTVGTRSR